MIQCYNDLRLHNATGDIWKVEIFAETSFFLLAKRSRKFSINPFLVLVAMKGFRHAKTFQREQNTMLGMRFTIMFLALRLMLNEVQKCSQTTYPERNLSYVSLF